MAEELSGDTWGERFILRAAARVRDARRAQGFSVRELSERTKQLGHEVTRQVLVNLEAGRRRALSIDDLFVIAHALGVNPLFLLFDQMQMGRPNEVLPDLEVPEWVALQWARSAPTFISSALYEEDFDGARGVISTREQIDAVRAEIANLERAAEVYAERGEESAAKATRDAIASQRQHEKTLLQFLERDGVQMNEAWFDPRALRNYRDYIWAPAEADSDG